MRFKAHAKAQHQFGPWELTKNMLEHVVIDVGYDNFSRASLCCALSPTLKLPGWLYSTMDTRHVIRQPWTNCNKSLAPLEQVNTPPWRYPRHDTLTLRKRWEQTRCRLCDFAQRPPLHVACHFETPVSMGAATHSYDCPILCVRLRLPISRAVPCRVSQVLVWQLSQRGT